MKNICGHPLYFVLNSLAAKLPKRKKFQWENYLSPNAQYLKRIYHLKDSKVSIKQRLSFQYRVNE